MKFQTLMYMTGCLAVLMAPGVANAHCGVCGKGESKAEGKSDKGHDHMAMMAKELNLTEEQKAKMQTIKDETRRQMEAVHQSAHMKMKAILNPEQQAKFDETAAKHCEACAKGGEHKH